ncbi:unnamed protein product, partial [Rotaria sp. Silwood1]
LLPLQLRLRPALLLLHRLPSQLPLHPPRQLLPQALPRRPLRLRPIHQPHRLLRLQRPLLLRLQRLLSLRLRPLHQLLRLFLRLQRPLLLRLHRLLPLRLRPLHQLLRLQRPLLLVLQRLLPLRLRPLRQLLRLFLRLQRLLRLLVLQQLLPLRLHPQAPLLQHRLRQTTSLRSIHQRHSRVRLLPLRLRPIHQPHQVLRLRLLLQKLLPLRLRPQAPLLLQHQQRPQRRLLLVIWAVNTLRSNTTDSTVVAGALSSYFSSLTNSNALSNPAYVLSAVEIDDFISSIKDVNFAKSTNESMVVALLPNQGNGITVLGAAFKRNTGGEVVNTGNINNSASSNFSVSATISSQSVSAVNVLRSNTTNSTVIADALSLYISSSTNSNGSLNSTYTLTVNDIDDYVTSINNVNFTRSTNESMLIAVPPNQGDGVFVLGASFTRGIGGTVVSTNNSEQITNTELSTAALISNQSLTGVTSLNMLIIDKPTKYENLDNSTEKKLASSVVVVVVNRNNVSSNQINISLFFQILNEYRPSGDVEYICSFYETSDLKWNESGCTAPQYNAVFNRYECNCNHLTSFALLWLPRVQLTRDLRPVDIASLVFQSISIVCFIIIIINAIVMRVRRPIMGFRAYDILPLISSASTTILFAFYIALSMTVYTKTTSENESQCFLSSSVLMFFVYFFLIFMFCAKTSVGYFNYLRFVHLFPEPSLRKLFVMLAISFVFSIAWIAFAVGFNSNSSFKITQLYPYKICWFTRDVIYYFLTIPVCLFLLVNIIIFIRVAQRIISHVRHAKSPHKSYGRMKRCVLILLSSCATQGIGWLFGPFLTFVNPDAGKVLEWIFNIFNGLEGLWSILLYMIIRSTRMDEQKRSVAARELSKTKSTIIDKDKKSNTDDDQNGTHDEIRESQIERRRRENENRDETREHDIQDLRRKNKEPHIFDDLYDLKDCAMPISNDNDS